MEEDSGEVEEKQQHANPEGEFFAIDRSEKVTRLPPSDKSEQNDCETPEDIC
jgi:hypothetical protein